MISDVDQRRQIGALSDTVQLLGGASADATVWTGQGITASIVPSAPSTHMANVIVYSTPHALHANLPEITAAYEAAGVAACRVWEPSWHGGAATQALTAARFVRRGLDPAMVLQLDSFKPDDSREPWWDSDGDLSTLAEINARADPDAHGLTDALTQLPPGFPIRVYRSFRDGEVAAVLCTIDREDDCSLAWVATVPEARRKGMSTALVGAAIGDAKRRGCRTSSLQASSMGAPMYQRLGWRTVGAFAIWDRNS